MKEKRQHQRAVLRVSVAIRGQADDARSEGQTWAAESEDISLGGMFILGDTLPPIGTEVQVEFVLPGLGPVRMPAYVRWKREVGVGLQFGLIGPRETHAIGRLVRGSVPGI